MTAVVSLTDFLPAPRYDGVPWTQAKIEEAPASTGTWTVKATVTLSPVDADPSNPAERSFTLTNASAVTGYWYRVTFLDGAAGAGEPSAPVYNGPPDLLASVDELEARLGIELTADEEQRAIGLLTTASALVRSCVKQNITKISGDVWVTRGVFGNRLRVPQRPVVSVASVTASFMGATAVTIDPTTYFVDRDELVRYDWPLSFTIGNGWLGPGWKLTVTYDHGYDPAATQVPYQLALCKTVALEAVARVWVNPAGASQSMIGGVQAAYPSVGLMLTEDEEEDLADAFRQTAGSVTLR